MPELKFNPKLAQLVPGSLEDRESKNYQKALQVNMDALQEVADDWVKNLSSDSRTFVLTDHLA
jgi:hypothetical protein